MGPIQKLEHVNINTHLPQETIDFYVNVLGLENRPEDRPGFGYDGAWLWAGDTAVVHLVWVDEDPGPVSGPVDHVAFAINDFEGLTARLEEMGVDYSSKVRPEMGLKQIVVRDPNGVKVELSMRGN